LKLVLVSLLLGLRPQGAQFLVSTQTTGSQLHPVVAASPGGTFVVVWQGPGTDEDSSGIYGQRYNFAGAKIGSTFRVNTYTTGGQTQPAVAMDATNGFVVAWMSYEDGSDSAIVARVYDRFGDPGTPFRVNSQTTFYQESPAVAMDSGGSFVVVFQGYDADPEGVFGRRYLALGNPLAPDFQVNETTTDRQNLPSISLNAGGVFTVVWRNGSTPNVDVFARRFARNGVAFGPDFRVNSVTTGVQWHPAISVNPAGTFVVVWSTGSYPQMSDISARAFSSNGVPLTTDVRVNTYTTAFGRPAVLALPDGGFVVAYSGFDAALPAAGREILLRQFDKTGVPVGSEMRVNTYTTGVQGRPRIAGHARGFVVVWESDSGDGDGSGVFGRRFASTTEAGDATGDGIVDLADVFYLINFLFAAGPAPIP